MFLTKLFNGIDRQYLIKSYVIGAICTIIVWQLQAQVGNHSFGMILYFGISLVLFPFATIVWDDFIALMAGGMAFILPLPIMLIWKVFKIGLLYMFSVFIAPIGIIYILLANKLRQ